MQVKLDEALASDAIFLGMDDLETFEWRGVDLLWERKP